MPPRLLSSFIGWMKKNCQKLYPNCHRGCPSVEAHRALFACINKKEKKVNPHTSIPSPSPKINYQKLQEFIKEAEEDNVSR
jgi:hypothetical protein